MASDSASSMGQLEEARRFGREAIDASEDPGCEPFVWAFMDLAQVALFEGDVSARIRTSPAPAQLDPADSHDRFVLASRIMFGGMFGDPLTALELRTALLLVQEAGMPTAIAIATAGAVAALWGSDGSSARPELLLAIELVHESGNRFMEQTLRPALMGQMAGFTDPRQVLTSAIDVVEAWRLNGDTAFAAGMGVLIRLLITQEDTENAVRLYGAVTRTIKLDALVHELADDIEAARIHLSPDRFDDLRMEGAQLSYQAAADLARQRIDVAVAAAHDDP